MNKFGSRGINATSPHVMESRFHYDPGNVFCGIRNSGFDKVRFSRKRDFSVDYISEIPEDVLRSVEEDGSH